VRRLWLIVLVFVVVGSVHAAGFSISKYLYPNESIDSITSEMITYHNENYTLYLYDDNPLLLVYDDDVVTDSDVVKPVLRSYYTNKYFPNGVDLSGIQDKLVQFNKSRNMDYNYSTRDFTAHTPEDSCTHSLGFVDTSGGIDLDMCYDNESCYNVALGLAMRFEGKKIDYDDVPHFAEVILNYRNDIVGINNNLEKAMNLTTTSDVDTLYDNLMQLKSAIASIKTYAEDVKETPARYPDSTTAPCLYDAAYIEQHGKCFGFCSELPYDIDALDDAIDDVDDLLDSAEPISKADDISAELAKQGTERKDYSTKKGMLTQLTISFNGVENMHNKSLKEADDVLLLVNHAELANLTTTIKELRTKIRTEIDTINVTNDTENEIKTLGNDYLKLEELLKTNITADYYKIAQLRKEIASQFTKEKFIIPKTKEYVEKYNAIGEEYNKLEQTYSPPLTPNGYKNYYEKYSAISYNLSVLYNEILSTQSGTVSQVATNVKHSAVDGAFTLASSFVSLDTGTKKSLEPVIPISLLVVTDLSVISIIALAFVGLVYTNRFYLVRKRIVITWALGFLVIITIVGAASVAGWYLMTEGASPTDVDGAIAAIKGANETIIAVDASGASTDSISAMKSCAAELLKNSELSNAKYYVIEPDRCLYNGATKTPEECYADLETTPNIYMVYNRDDAKKGYFFNGDKGSITISGEADIFNECEVFYMFND